MPKVIRKRPSATSVTKSKKVSATRPNKERVTSTSRQDLEQTSTSRGKQRPPKGPVTVPTRQSTRLRHKVDDVAASHANEDSNSTDKEDENKDSEQQEHSPHTRNSIPPFTNTEGETNSNRMDPGDNEASEEHLGLHSNGPEPMDEDQAGVTDEESEESLNLPRRKETQVVSPTSQPRATDSEVPSIRQVSENATMRQARPRTSGQPGSNTSEAAIIRKLTRKLKEAKEKNQRLRKEKNKNQKSRCTTGKPIPKPKGCVGRKGFSLMAEMGFDKNDQDDRDIYNAIKDTVRKLAIQAGLKTTELTYKKQSMVKMGNLVLLAREKQPCLARYENDWATGELVRQYITNRRKYEAKKKKAALAAKAAKAAKAAQAAEPDEDDVEDEGVDGSSNDLENDSSGSGLQSDEEDPGSDIDVDSETEFRPDTNSFNHSATQWGDEVLSDEEFLRRTSHLRGEDNDSD